MYQSNILETQHNNIEPDKWESMEILQLYQQMHIMENRKNLIEQLYPNNYDMLAYIQEGIEQIKNYISIREIADIRGM